MDGKNLKRTLVYKYRDAVEVLLFILWLPIFPAAVVWEMWAEYLGQRKQKPQGFWTVVVFSVSFIALQIGIIWLGWLVVSYWIPSLPPPPATMELGRWTGQLPPDAQWKPR